MPLFDGTFNVEEIYKGDVAVPEVYRGPEQVFPFNVSPPTPTPGGDGTISSTDDDDRLVLKSGNTYKVIVQSTETVGFIKNRLYEIRNVYVSSDEHLVFDDTFRLPTGKGSQKETYEVSFSGGGTVFGVPYTGTSVINNAEAYISPDSEYAEYRVVGMAVPMDFSASHTWGATNPAPYTVGSRQASITITFTGDVRLTDTTVSTFHESWIEKPPSENALAVQVKLSGGAFYPVTSGVTPVPEDAVDPGIVGYESSGTGMYMDNVLVSTNIADDHPFSYASYLPASYSEGASVYTIINNTNYIMSRDDIPQTTWEENYAGKTTYYTGASVKVSNRVSYPMYRGFGVIWHIITNHKRKDTDAHIDCYECISVDEMDGKQYTNEPVWLFGLSTGSGTNLTQIYGYEEMRTVIGEAFTEQECPPVAYIDYYTQVADDGTVRHIVTDCHINPAGIVS